MLKNYLTIALRNVSRNKVFSFINIAGLSIGLACCMLIFLYTKDEISYDRFHQRQAHLYRITSIMTDKNDQSGFKSGITGMVVGEAFKREIPEIEDFTRIKDNSFIIKKGKDTFNEPALYVDNNFFSIFSFSLLEGNPATALRQINSVVLTEETANKYFGTTDVLGKALQLEVNGSFESFIVTGLAEKAPQNSTIKFGMLLPFEHYKKNNLDDQWLNFFLNTFVVLHPKADIQAVENKFATVFATNAKEQLVQAKKDFGFNGQVTFGLQPLLDIHLNPVFGPDNGLVEGSQPIYSYILTGIAIFILLIACINFVNLTIAQSLKRSKEIGIRKVVGGMRKQLIRQFLGESLVVCILAFSLAIFLVVLILPLFNELANKKLSLSYLADTYLFAGYALLLLGTALGAGFYPALVLSGFKPVQVLYGRQKLTGKNYFAKSLIVVQFALATFLIIGTIAVYSQFNFLLNKDLGYNDENLVRINMPRFRQGNTQLLGLIKNEWRKQPSIMRVAGRNGGENVTIVRTVGKDVMTHYNKIDENYLPAFQIPLIAGRNFSTAFPSDSSQSVIINESFAKEAGWKNPVGQQVDFFTRNKKMTVIGVVKDYHFRSLKEKIGPQLFTQDNNVQYGQIWVKIKPDNIPQTLGLLENSYKKLVPFFPYEYEFLDTINARNYEAEAKWKQIIGYASLLSIFISCIGLFGLTTLAIEQRAKEIGIRKVLGASITGIVALLSKEFVVLVIIAFLIAIPLGYYATYKWLENFAYRIEMHWWIFLLVGILSLLIAFLTVSFQSFKAALANPVKSLRNE
jgi:putative ABC transport system permease protein